MKCIGCDYYDSSVDCCNADEICYQDGFEKGKMESQKSIKHIVDILVLAELNNQNPAETVRQITTYVIAE